MIQDTTDYHLAQIRMICVIRDVCGKKHGGLDKLLYCCIFVSVTEANSITLIIIGDENEQ